MNAHLRALCFVVTLASATAQAKQLWEQPWVEVRSPHFVMVSAISQQRAVNLLNDLENFRAAIEGITNIRKFDERVPTKVYVLDRRDEAFIDADATGWFMPRMRANYALVIPNSSAGFAAIIKHEYTHFLLHNADATQYPRWFDEGFAMKFETMEVHDTTVEFGQPSAYVLRNLQYGTWITFERVLGSHVTRDFTGNDEAMFYVQSWLLVHYLTERPGHDFRSEMTAYLADVEAGAKPVDAFNRAFALRPEQLRTLLYDYQRNKMRTTKIALTAPFPVQPIRSTVVAPDSIATQLGTLLLERDREADAKRYFEAAHAINPNNADALVGLGDLLKFEGKFEEAQPYYPKAIDLEPTNPYHELDYGEFFADRADARPEQSTADLVEARRHFARAHALDPNIPETLAMNGETYFREPQSIDKAVASLSAAHSLLPSEYQITLLLAQAYALSDQKPLAIKLVRATLPMIGDRSKDADEAKKLLDKWGASEAADSSLSDSTAVAQ